ncbi:MarR family transcriptional regulator [Rhodococcoides yunnanense]|uniref:MarR family transcriptional regulator n=1 Tax=Rhodococcoides yunnanense TaxID=278209 RepID=UPI003530056E
MHLEERPVGLGSSWACQEVLQALAQQERMTYGDLESRLVRHRTTVGATVNALEKSGLVAREPNPMKRQQVVVRLTGRGEALPSRANRAWVNRSQGHTDTTLLLDAIRTVERHCVRPETIAQVHLDTLEPHNEAQQ